MAIALKCNPSRLDKDHIFASEALPVAKSCTPEVGDEVFVWFTKGSSQEGLAAHGRLASLSSEDKSRFSFRVELYASEPASKLSDDDLAKYDLRDPEVIERPGDPRHRLCEKLYAYSPRRVVGIDIEEAILLRRHFNEASGSERKLAKADQVKSAVQIASQDGESVPFLAEGAPFESDVVKLIDHDLSEEALEGLSLIQITKRRQRAYKLAHRFINDRLHKGSFVCEKCAFDPTKEAIGTQINPRSLLDVHHINPLTEGIRKSRLMDFRLLCPNCHRFEHALLRVSSIMTR